VGIAFVTLSLSGSYLYVLVVPGHIGDGPVTKQFGAAGEVTCTVPEAVLEQPVVLCVAVTVAV
jgi:hypothetical protein